MNPLMIGLANPNAYHYTSKDAGGSRKLLVYLGMPAIDVLERDTVQDVILQKGEFDKFAVFKTDCGYYSGELLSVLWQKNSVIGMCRTLPELEKFDVEKVIDYIVKIRTINGFCEANDGKNRIGGNGTSGKKAGAPLAILQVYKGFEQ